ncbi:MAG: hypothetical protein IT440_04955, partial [Phycisphaeraceae bacterium]|nr:hypothetical protein [Phycisphaeraceae bacterium]
MQPNDSIVIEGRFGLAQIDTRKPELKRLFLRQHDGSLSLKSLLSEHSPCHRNWAVGGYSYAVEADGTRYESRHSCHHSVEQTADGWRISGVRLCTATGRSAPLLEDWEFCLDDAGTLRWQIKRRWQEHFNGHCCGSPSLFFHSRPNPRSFGDRPIGKLGEITTESRECHERRRAYVNPAGNGVTTAVWFDSDHLQSSWDPLYSTFAWGDNQKPHPMFTPNLCITVTNPDSWAVVKLYTSFPL